MAYVVNPVSPTISYTASAGQTVFTVPFVFFDATDLIVKDNGVVQSSATYTVAGTKTTSGGSVTFLSGRTLGHTITIDRSVPIQRITDFPTSGPFNVDLLNEDLDRIIAVQQELALAPTAAANLLANAAAYAAAAGSSASAASSSATSASGAATSASASQSAAATSASDAAAALVAASSAAGAQAQVRLSYVSTTQIRLDPYGGLKLAINGSNRDLPGAGVTLSNSGLSASTLYYIYAYWTGSAVALEATTTSHSASATTGVRIKTADATRTLVGMARTDASSLFFETATSAGVASYYNRRSRAVFRQVTPSTASATPVTVGNAVQFLVWSDESIDTRISGYGQNNTAGAATLIYMLVDSTVIGYPSYGYSSAAGAQTPVGITHALGTTEGFHSLDAQVQIGTAGTGNWSYSISALTRI